MRRTALSSLCCVAALYAGWQLLRAVRRRATARRIAEAAARARRPLAQPPSAVVLSFTCRAGPGAPLSQAFP